MKIRFLLFILLGMSVLLVNCTKDNPEDLLGKWEVIKVIDKDGNSFKPEETLILEFLTSEGYGMTLDRNGCGGSYNTAGSNKITFDKPACTDLCCDSDEAESLRRTISDMSSYKLKARKLILDGDGKIVLKAKR